jgi:tetratricopeptide (TPR) repeat protein
MLTTEAISPWLDYPMGPQLRRFLGVTEDAYRGADAPRPTVEQVGAFQQFLDQVFEEQLPHDQAEFVDLIEELTAMGLSAPAVALADRCGMYSIEGDFRACLSLGSALMMESELDEAILLLSQAQGLAPMEIAPYVNLTSIYYALERDEEARHWADRGLQVDPNNFRLWEIIASMCLHEDKLTAGDRVRAKAEPLNSYAGLTLAADLLDPNDRLLKAQFLDEVFNAGLRDDEFLIEYTAVLGLAQQFEKIPQIVWRLEHLEKKTIHWKLYAHAAQAHLALNQEEQAAELIRRASLAPDAQAHVLHDLQQIHDQQMTH